MKTGCARIVLTCLALGLALPAGNAAPPPDSTSEYRLKAALIYRIAKFVRWPQGDAASGLGICVLGEDPFGASLDELETLTVRDTPVRVYRKINLRDLGQDCSVVYVSDSERGRLDIVLARLGDQPVLTVADFDGFSEAGGMIEFSRTESRISFEINVAASDSAGLNINSQLLQVASKVIRGTGE